MSLALTAAPAFAQGRSRLSADLADHVRAGSPIVNIIVHGDRAEVEALARRYNVRVKKILASGGVLTVNAGQLAAMRDNEPDNHFSGDLPVLAHGAVTAAAIGADQVWAGIYDEPGLSGKGIGVAVIDSGMDTAHAALRRRVVATVDFTGGDGQDRYGHGTHVAALIAGRPGKTMDTAAFRGIAYDARLINLRVLGDDGSGLASDAIEAIDWAIAHKRQYNIKVINLSLGAPVLQPYRDDPLCEAAERAVHAGIVVVAAAGNYGRTEDGKTVLGGITSPANDPSVIAVGALDAHDTPRRSDDTLATFSSRGPTQYDLVLKPDVAAPGRRVTSAEAAGSYLSTTYPERHVTGSGDGGYMQLSGTSMAAGVVSGAVALMLEEQSNLRPRQSKAVLQLTSSFMPEVGMLGAGAGSINVAGAVALLGEPGNQLPSIEIAGEPTTASGLAFLKPGTKVHSQTVVWGNALLRGITVVWG